VLFGKEAHFADHGGDLDSSVVICSIVGSPDWLVVFLCPDLRHAAHIVLAGRILTILVYSFNIKLKMGHCAMFTIAFIFRTFNSLGVYCCLNVSSLPSSSELLPFWCIVSTLN